jgi:hypothetical protein
MRPQTVLAGVAVLAADDLLGWQRPPLAYGRCQPLPGSLRGIQRPVPPGREWLSKYLVGDDPLALVELPEQLAELRREVEGLQHGYAQEYGPDPGSPLRAGPAA